MTNYSIIPGNNWALTTSTQIIPYNTTVDGVTIINTNGVLSASGSGGVTSVIGNTGTVTLSQLVTGGVAPLASPSFTGTCGVTGTNGSPSVFNLYDTSNSTYGCGISINGDGSNPGKTLRVHGGIFGIVNNAYNSVLLTLDDSGNLSNIGSFSSTSGTFSGLLTTSSGEAKKTRVITASGAITGAFTDRYIIINKTTGAASAISLPASPPTGTIITVMDGKGDANTNNITVTPTGVNVNGTTTYVMNLAYQSTVFIFNGIQWNAGTGV